MAYITACTTVQAVMEVTLLRTNAITARQNNIHSLALQENAQAFNKNKYCTILSLFGRMSSVMYYRFRPNTPKKIRFDYSM